MGEYEGKSYEGEILLFRCRIMGDWFRGIDGEGWGGYMKGRMEEEEIDWGEKEMWEGKGVGEI
ncbi:hypothetical protein, partial [Bacillus sp. WP8]|uniref:hypothetical protein n=1 Tax=Bacillus sp. WP8 TaxID=756828 RepID=UPI0011AA576C